MTTPQISILLTSYNHEKYIRRSIESILDQSFGDFELLINDDRSDDASWDIINSYSDPRIRATRSAVNTLGFAYSKLETFRGKYYAIVHSDDWWEANKLAKQYAFMEANAEMGAVFTRVNIVGERGDLLPDGSHIFTGIFEEHNKSRAQWLRFFFEGRNALCHPSVLIRMSRIAECDYYRYGLYQLADMDLWVRMCLRSPIHILDDRLMNFRVRDGDKNMSSPTAATATRSNSELSFVYDHFLGLNDIAEFMEIFPDSASRWPTPSGDAALDIPFMLAMHAVAPDMPPAGRAFGLRILFDLLNDDARRAAMERHFAFGIKEFVEVSGAVDPFGMRFEAAVRERDERIRVLEEQVRAARDRRSGSED